MQEVDRSHEGRGRLLKAALLQFDIIRDGEQSRGGNEGGGRNTEPALQDGLNKSCESS